MSLKKKKISNNFQKITIGLASPESILQESFGEVIKPETINYRSHKPERGGLFCERIFGPIKDYECACGKYKRIRYKGIICDRCGVEIADKNVRRDRIGHIRLVIPVVHIWYFKSLPNKIGYLLGFSSKKLDMIIYYERYLVIQVGVACRSDKTPLENMALLTENEYLSIIERLPLENQTLNDSNPNKFIAMMGAECIEELLKRLNLDDLAEKLRKESYHETSKIIRMETLKRLQVIEAFRESANKTHNRREWMIIHILPIIPPELRPLIPLDGGSFATSDLNDLYRKIIIRNNRLKRLLQIHAPEVILRNEKRMLQEAVDSLYENTKKSYSIKSEGNRPLKSLSDFLKGKQGRFRQNLLGKRVDYSARSVIVVGPKLKLHECGVPKDMAAELYKPFIIRKLIERGLVKTVKSAKKMIDTRKPAVWEILENVMKGHPVLLNRAPTLHRLGIQSFQPKLIEGKAIQLHPLVCTAFNADFDGDQMAVHLPLGPLAILEAQLLMLSTQNILNPANGSPITVPSQDMVLGLYYMTKELKSTPYYKVKGEGIVFSSTEEVQIAYNANAVSINACIKVKVPIMEDKDSQVLYKIVETTVGRVLFNKFVPTTIVGYINELLTKNSLRDIIGRIFTLTNITITVKFLDDIKELGFYNAFKGGFSFSLKDIIIPNDKQSMVKNAIQQIDSVIGNYNMGLISNQERYNQVIDIWTNTNVLLTEKVMSKMQEDKKGFNSVYIMLESGARGSKEQIRQLSGMRGLMAKPQRSGVGSGEIIENPIISNFREGLSILEYFISTHGARKGLADTALKTADAGYLTRRLVDVAQDVIIREEDCLTIRGLEIGAVKKNEEIVELLSYRILGRITLYDIYNPNKNEVIVSADEMIDEECAYLIEKLGIETVQVRSPLTCESKSGICAKCYGRNLSTGKLVQKGEAVGVIAAQSIGEPGTQLTLRTFHVGGTAVNIVEASSQIIARFDGIIEFEDLRSVHTYNEMDKFVELVVSRYTEMKLRRRDGTTLITHHIPYGSTLFVQQGNFVDKGTEICRWDPYNAVIIAECAGIIAYEAIEKGVTFQIEDEQAGIKEKVILESRDKKLVPSLKILNEDKREIKRYNLPVGAHLIVENGDRIKVGKVIAKIPRQYGKMTDITGGLPRVTELCEARNPSNLAIISDIDGVVSFGNMKRGNREIFIVSKTGEIKRYLVKVSNQIIVQENDYVKAGTALSEGMLTPEDMLNIKGSKAVQEYLVNEIQEIYRLQGVKINEKHFEIIVRQMMLKVKIVDAGDTRFLEDSIEHKTDFIEENNRIFGMKVVEDPGDSDKFKYGQQLNLVELSNENELLDRLGKKNMKFRVASPATAKPILQGITRAALHTKSFISAASFQETTRVLNEAAISGKTDDLLGLKENVIVGHKIPAGTGLREYQDFIVSSKIKFDEIPLYDIQ